VPDQLAQEAFELRFGLVVHVVLHAHLEHLVDADQRHGVEVRQHAQHVALTGIHTEHQWKYQNEY
jgi:hypothetical protein